MKHSVQGTGRERLERSWQLCIALEPTVVRDTVPPWVEDANPGHVFERCNRWLLAWAHATEGAEVTLIALWNGKVGEGARGTAGMIELARQRGARIIRIDSSKLMNES
jgi:hypothetical protein